LTGFENLWLATLLKKLETAPCGNLLQSKLGYVAICAAPGCQRGYGAAGQCPSHQGLRRLPASILGSLNLNTQVNHTEGRDLRYYV